MIRARLAVVALVVLAALAGCSSPAADGNATGTSADQGQDVSIAIRNEHDRSYTVAVRTVPGGVAGIEVRYANGSTRTFDVASLDGVPRQALRNATDLATVDGSGTSEEFRVGPNQGLGTTLEGVPANATVVYFVRPESGTGNGTETRPLRGAGVVRCAADSAATELAITIRADGSLHSQVTCGDATA